MQMPMGIGESGRKISGCGCGCRSWGINMEVNHFSKSQFRFSLWDTFTIPQRRLHMVFARGGAQIITFYIPKMVCSIAGVHIKSRPELRMDLCVWYTSQPTSCEPSCKSHLTVCKHVNFTFIYTQGILLGWTLVMLLMALSRSVIYATECFGDQGIWHYTDAAIVGEISVQIYLYQWQKRPGNPISDLGSPALLPRRATRSNHTPEGIGLKLTLWLPPARITSPNHMYDHRFCSWDISSNRFSRFKCRLTLQN